MVIREEEARHEHVMEVAKAMMAAARTAPKGKGIDRLTIIAVDGEQKQQLADEMRRYSERSGFKFFLRDALNVEQSSAVVIIGTSFGEFALNCGFCGFATCAEKAAHPAIPCAFNTNDLGIAVGSAASVAADYRIDSRIMYSVARAALDLGMLPDCKAAFGIVLSCEGKNPFFDRTAHKQ